MAGAPLGWLLYDGTCGFCAWWVPAWAPRLARIGVAVAPLQSAWVARRTGLGTEELLADVCLLLADGRLVRGADVYRWCLRRWWWARPLWVLAAMPGGRLVFDTAYRAFARHRHGVSRACRLRPTHA